MGEFYPFVSESKVTLSAVLGSIAITLIICYN